MNSLRTLIVDDEPLARSRLRTLLAECDAPAADVIGEAAQAREAEQRLDESPTDLVLLDIHMPGVDGTEFARQLRGRTDAPAIVFVTAHSGHAVTAFELDAVDYLTKPVRAERLQQALQKAERYLKEKRAALPDPNEEVFLIQDRGRAERVPVSEVVYLKSEFKYLTVRTSSRSHIYDASLAEIEERYPDRFVRVHRNALVARSAMRALEKYDDGEDIDGWALRLRGIAEPVVVSRRQLSVVRDALKDLR
ncbi:LytTR family DNA-binding domain-containing protein [Variovorax robiniae]|uniref:LytTR family DNA-binding domain-containing protein n=1 Tax=Variovorax robiniae TaxID=1836199 RepID=A0ABU8X8V7_9BURK